MTPFEYQQNLRSQILGSYSNAPTLIKSKEDQPLDGKSDEEISKEKEKSNSSDNDI